MTRPLLLLLLLGCTTKSDVKDPSCAPNTHPEDGQCVPDDPDVVDSATETGLSCPKHASPSGGQCVCDDGWISDASCASCVRDDGDGCPDQAYAYNGGCICVAGYAPNPEACGCEPAGRVGAPCERSPQCSALIDAGASSVVCADAMNDWSGSSLSTAFPGGFCTVASCSGADKAACDASGGVCVEANGVAACVPLCIGPQACREGYQCRGFSELPEAPALTYCLP